MHVGNKVVLLVEVVVVVVVMVGQVPATVGFTTLNCFAPWFVTCPSAPKRTSYVSPPPISSRTQPSVPGFGGTTARNISLPAATALTRKSPLPDFFSSTVLTGPFSPPRSWYLKPLTASPLQNGCLVDALMPAGSAKICAFGVPPLATIERVAPAATGLPTMVWELATSFAVAMTLRFAGLVGSGFLTTSWAPRMV
jgi:hypothetical protein